MYLIDQNKLKCDWSAKSTFKRCFLTDKEICSGHMIKCKFDQFLRDNIMKIKTPKFY